MTKTLHRLDLLKEFPKYDYAAPRQAWLIDYRRADNMTASQIQAFHYYHANKMCGDTGLVGVSLIMPSIPYCLCVAPKPGTGVHVVSPIENLVNLVEPGSLPIIIISSAISLLKCQSVPEDATPEVRKRRACPGAEIIPILREWSNLLMPEGVMIANLIDEAIAREAGWSLFQKDPNIRHSWSPSRFEEHIIGPLSDVLTLEEFNNLGNNLTFQAVLRKI